MDDTLYWLWLAEAVGSACDYMGDLLALYPSPRALYACLRDGGAMPGFVSRRAAAALRSTEPQDFEERQQLCEDMGVEILTPDSPNYPDRLRFMPDRPAVLYATGSTACLNGRRYVGMVGTRRPTSYGSTACHEISLELAKRGAVIVSGLADGLDGEGHRAAVEAGCATVAFLGTAIDITYPAANARLRQQIENEVGGAVLSEYPPCYAGRAKGTFLARNRLIAAMSEVLCIAEARKRSGTMNTVAHAERYGRPVLSVPGSIFSKVSEGTNELLRTRRAGALCSADDALAAIGMQAEGESNPLGEDAFDPDTISPQAKTVLAVLGPRPLAPNEICRQTALPAHIVLAALTELELAGAAAPQLGGMYVSAI